MTEPGTQVRILSLSQEGTYLRRDAGGSAVIAYDNKEFVAEPIVVYQIMYELPKPQHTTTVEVDISPNGLPLSHPTPYSDVVLVGGVLKTKVDTNAPTEPVSAEVPDSSHAKSPGRSNNRRRKVASTSGN